MQRVRQEAQRLGQGAGDAPPPQIGLGLRALDRPALAQRRRARLDLRRLVGGALRFRLGARLSSSCEAAGQPDGVHDDPEVAADLWQKTGASPPPSRTERARWSRRRSGWQTGHGACPELPRHSPPSAFHESKRGGHLHCPASRAARSASFTAAANRARRSTLKARPALPGRLSPSSVSNQTRALKRSCPLKGSRREADFLLRVLPHRGDEAAHSSALLDRHLGPQHVSGVRAPEGAAVVLGDGLDVDAHGRAGARHSGSSEAQVCRSGCSPARRRRRGAQQPRARGRSA